MTPAVTTDLAGIEQRIADAGAAVAAAREHYIRAVRQVGEERHSSDSVAHREAAYDRLRAAGIDLRYQQEQLRTGCAGCYERHRRGAYPAACGQRHALLLRHD